MSGIRPDYRLEANSQDVTDRIRDRLISMRWSDAAGMDSDMLEVVLADHDPLAPIEIPASGAELDLSLGYDGQAQRIGLFIFDEIEMSGWPGEMTIRARAAPFDKSKGGKSNLQTQKTRSWKVNTTINGMVKTIAKEHGMEAAVSKSLASIKLPHIDQANESDLNLLVRIGKKYDAVVKPSGGKLILAKRGESKSVGGQELPTITLAPEGVTSWRLVKSARETAGTVVAYWHAVKQSRRNEVKVGSGEPVRQLRQYYPTSDMALAAARSELERRKRAQMTISITMPGDPNLIAEASLKLEGWRDGIPTEWIITKAEHSLDSGGYRTTIEAEQPNTGE